MALLAVLVLLLSRTRLARLAPPSSDQLVSFASTRSATADECFHITGGPCTHPTAAAADKTAIKTTITTGRFDSGDDDISALITAPDLTESNHVSPKTQMTAVSAATAAAATTGWP